MRSCLLEAYLLDITGIGGTGKQAFKTFFKAQIRPDWLKKELPAAILDQAVMEAYSAWSKTKKNPQFIVRLCRSLDKMQSQRDLLKGHKNCHLRYRLNQKMKRKRRKIRNLVDEMHRKTASWLARNYRVIALPTYESSQMVC
ncbi:MAG: transposase, partial [Kamptonema sp. SIO4C4]|nr:transposase [Kamptonema sp. SIO4C4]